MTIECPICLDTIKYAVVGSCMHHYCYYCLFNYCKKSNENNKYPECSLCKEKINEIKFDREFEILNNNINLPELHFEKEIKIYPIINIHNPGLTISNNLRGPGVIVNKVNINGLFYKYNIKKGDIIIFINGINCYNHKIVMEQIMNLFNSNKPIYCILLN